MLNTVGTLHFALQIKIELGLFLRTRDCILDFDQFEVTVHCLESAGASSSYQITGKDARKAC